MDFSAAEYADMANDAVAALEDRVLSAIAARTGEDGSVDFSEPFSAEESAELAHCWRLVRWPGAFGEDLEVNYVEAVATGDERLTDAIEDEMAYRRGGRA